MTLSERARTGLREMPSNAAWLLSRALKPAEAVGEAAESATAAPAIAGAKVRAAVLDAAPVGGDSVDDPDETRPRGRPNERGRRRSRRSRPRRSPRNARITRGG